MPLYTYLSPSTVAMSCHLDVAFFFLHYSHLWFINLDIWVNRLLLNLSGEKTAAHFKFLDYPGTNHACAQLPFHVFWCFQMSFLTRRNSTSAQYLGSTDLWGHFCIVSEMEVSHLEVSFTSVKIWVQYKRYSATYSICRKVLSFLPESQSKGLWLR